jgi:hypothetical protein
MADLTVIYLHALSIHIGHTRENPCPAMRNRWVMSSVEPTKTLSCHNAVTDKTGHSSKGSYSNKEGYSNQIGWGYSNVSPLNNNTSLLGWNQAKSNVLPPLKHKDGKPRQVHLNPKQKKLRQAVHGCRQLNLRFNLAEIASVAGISERSAHNRNKEILGYWLEESATSNEDKKLILERSIELGIEAVLANQEPNLEDMFGVILGTYLKVETNLLGKAESLKEVRTLGRHLTRIYRMVCSYKNEEGVPVHSRYLSAKYLLDSKAIDKLDELFIRSKDYVIHRRAKRWKATSLLIKYVEASIKELLERMSVMEGRKLVYLSPHMCLQNYAKMYM